VAQPGSPAADREWLREAVELSRRCPPSATAFSVGAVLVGADGVVLSTGYSRELEPADHAEEVALARLGLPAPGREHLDWLASATLYSSLEPCAARAWQEPPVFVPGGGAVRLRQAGVAVVVMPELAAAASEVNAHLLGPQAGRP
jgi:diaminohydroxyphosphoribosylaminopyrimidine deaminase/5-amino-6-(5-phosphoribosylamino)uracil reductase